MLRVGICGLGSAAIRGHLPALMRPSLAEVARVVAICDRDPRRLATATDLLPLAAAYTELDDLLQTESLDLLVIATPPSAHMSAIRLAVNHGVHIACEKPLGLTEDDLSDLQGLHASSPSTMIATVLQYRHATSWQQLAIRVREELKQRRPLWIHIDVERPGTDPLSAEGWRSQPQQEGGILGDHAVHHLALLTEVLPGLRIRHSERQGAGGRETATIEMAADGASASIRLTYAGSRRCNRLRASFNDEVAIWEDGRLVLDNAIHTQGSLSDRRYVNDLYAPWYDQLLTDLADSSARLHRTTDTLAVAHLLRSAIASSEDVAAAEPSLWEQLSLSSVARSVLLAFADLGVYLPSQRDRVIAKIRALDPMEPGQLQEFLDLCIVANLITREDAGRLCLSPVQAKVLANSLEGTTPVPDAQASEWASLLGGLVPSF